MKTVPFGQQDTAQWLQTIPTPFYIYDEEGIKASCQALNQAFSWISFKEYFAVKALPNPSILKLVKSQNIGADCSSLAELKLAAMAGIQGEEIMFTANNTPEEDYIEAAKLGAIINLDDITHIDYLEKVLGKLPETLSFRYNPGSRRAGNSIIGEPVEAKYGLTHEQLFEAYKIAQTKGVKHFWLHTMVISNELNGQFFVDTADMLFDLVQELKSKHNIIIEGINLGGGIGIPYRPEHKPVDIAAVGKAIEALYQEKITGNQLDPLKIAMECGRVITGPHGYLVTKAIHRKSIYKDYIGVDACMANLMRPGMYGAYHHITVLGKENAQLDHTYDVTGALCENNDKFAINRQLPKIEIGDVLVIHDAGAHGHAMGFNYNGKLRSAEYLMDKDHKLTMIRRAETLEDHFATLSF